MSLLGPSGVTIDRGLELVPTLFSMSDETSRIQHRHEAYAHRWDPVIGRFPFMLNVPEGSLWSIYCS